MMGYGGFGGMGALGWPGMLLGALVWVAVIALVVWGVGALFGQRGGAASEAPLEILKRRYARGEIGEAEFEQARRTLVDADAERRPQSGGRSTTVRTLPLALLGGVLLATLAVGGLSTALAQTQPGPWGPGGMMGGTGALHGQMMGGAGPGGMMSGAGPGGMIGGAGPGGMMGGAGPGGMMGGAWQGGPTTGAPLGSLSDAQQAFQGYLDRLGNADLALSGVVEFQYNFYAIVQEKSTGAGAFELLADKRTGYVMPEPGPNMMWNTKYGHMGGFGPGGMMGGWWGQTPGAADSVSAEWARELAQQWLDQYQPDSTSAGAVAFPGYYTLLTLKDGTISGMLSVNAASGQVWYHSWHGAFVATTEAAR